MCHTCPDEDKSDKVAASPDHRSEPNVITDGSTVSARSAEAAASASTGGNAGCARSAEEAAFVTVVWNIPLLSDC